MSTTLNKHTPGPWSVDPDRPFLVIDDGHNPASVAYIEGDGAEAAANARLIAAAPDLLASCKMLTKALIDLAPYDPDVAVAVIAIVECGRAAIAKAESTT